MEDAQSTAGAAREQFRELAEQVRALLAEEQADRIAAAQQMAAELARQQQDFADSWPSRSEAGGLAAKPQEQPMERQAGASATSQMPPKEARTTRCQAWAPMAEKIAEKAKTLADVLGAAARADPPEDEADGREGGRPVQAMDLPSLTERLKNLPGQVGEGKMEDAKATAGDGAETTGSGGRAAGGPAPLDRRSAGR